MINSVEKNRSSHQIVNAVSSSRCLTTDLLVCRRTAGGLSLLGIPAQHGVPATEAQGETHVRALEDGERKSVRGMSQVKPHQVRVAPKYNPGASWHVYLQHTPSPNKRHTEGSRTCKSNRDPRSRASCRLILYFILSTTLPACFSLLFMLRTPLSSSNRLHAQAAFGIVRTTRLLPEPTSSC